MIHAGLRFSEPAYTATTAVIGRAVGATAPAQVTGDALASSSRGVALVLALAAAATACTGGEPEPGAVRLAALTAGAAADVLSDLAAVGDPDAAGVRDAFHAANVTALESARLAHESAPRATRAAYALSLDAAESADRFAEALGAAVVRREAASPQLEAEMERRADEYMRFVDAHMESASRSDNEWETYLAESGRRRTAHDAASDAFRENGEALYRARTRLLLRAVDDRSPSDLVIEGLDSEEGLHPETVCGSRVSVPGSCGVRFRCSSPCLSTARQAVATAR